MTRKGMEAADEDGRRLPTFPDQESARIALYRRRDELLVRNVPEYEWVVEESAFLPGRFELGVARPRVKIMLGRETDHDTTPNNQRRQSLWRKYRQWSS